MEKTNIIHSLVAKETGINLKSVIATINLLEDGGTIPFISRYRKEVTGSLDEVEIAEIKTSFSKITELIKRKETVINSIQDQGKLTDELKTRIENCWDSIELEDIYLPYKQKRKTRASVAREKGLQPLAELFLLQGEEDPFEEAKKYLTEEVPTIEDAIQGAKDIIAENFHEMEAVRNIVRHAFTKDAFVFAKLLKGKEAEGEKFKDYFSFSEKLQNIPSHRYLAIRRGEEEGILRVTIEPEEEFVLQKLESEILENNFSIAKILKDALIDSYSRLIHPGIETEFRNSSKLKADLEAIKVFGENLKQLLLTAPLGQKSILGIDPGFRTGCKVVCVDTSGKLLYNTTIYPHAPQNDYSSAKTIIQSLVEKYNLEAIAVGNGTAGRETLSLCKEISFKNKIEIFMVSEAGASIYSASDIAREEFPDHDVTVRGSVSIARRLMDPLAELVKIDPKSIGVGQYQHDVNQNLLKENLDRIVESCVNTIGVNLNTASKHLLTYVSGLGPSLAKSIVDFRNENGTFKNREDLKKVPRLGAKAFEQSAGFLRVKNGINILDDTAVHPESYSIVSKMALKLNVTIEEFIINKDIRNSISLNDFVDEKIGLPTLKDIMSELDKPGVDPRGEAEPMEFMDGVTSISDLNPGMIVKGVVTNLTAFGAFVDIGVKQDGLLHISQITNKFIKNPSEVLSLNQKVQVKIVEVDVNRKRINLTMKGV
jgi:protein Tex